MIFLAAVVIGFAIGLLRGGSVDRLADLRLRWWPLAVLGLLAQVAVFSGPVASALEDAGPVGPVLYVTSTAAVGFVVLANVRVPGLAILAAGAALNLAAILANGGVMPADPGALAAAGLGPASGYSNSAVLADPALRPLTDIFAVPAGVPLANVFSVGDVLIGLGIVVAIASAMGRRPG